MRRSYRSSTISVDGYHQVATGKNKRRGVHTIIAERSLGRPLTKDEVVHHINGNKLDNRIENLIIVTRAWHKRIHNSIGKETRFKKVHSIDKNIAIKKYEELGSYERAAKYFGCGSATTWRIINQ